jgi:hypothetical protein
LNAWRLYYLRKPQTGRSPGACSGEQEKNEYEK